MVFLRMLVCAVLLGITLVHADAPGIAYLCPMHADVRRASPGTCPRCSMALVATVRESYDAYSLRVTAEPPSVPVGQPITLAFRVIAPDGHEVAASQLRRVHERLFHLFVVAEDLAFFEHVHPEPIADGRLQLTTRLPRAGRYQLIADFFPEAGTPQLAQQAIVTGGYDQALHAASPAPDTSQTNNEGKLRFSLSSLSLPAGRVVPLVLTITDEAGHPINLRPYLGASMHALAVSSDLRDAVHTHGEQTTPGVIAFELRLPRPGVHRVWLQVNDGRTVHTTSFTVVAETPKPAP